VAEPRQSQFLCLSLGGKRGSGTTAVGGKTSYASQEDTELAVGEFVTPAGSLADSVVQWLSSLRGSRLRRSGFNA